MNQAFAAAYISLRPPWGSDEFPKLLVIENGVKGIATVTTGTLGLEKHPVKPYRNRNLCPTGLPIHHIRYRLNEKPITP